jgi:hypothetical protein
MHLKRIQETYHKVIFKFPLEAIIWILGLLFLALYHPVHQEHMSICIFHNLGFKYCPGCGLGRSVSFLLHGDITSSLKAHPLGIAAVLILVYRIIQLLIDFSKRLKIKYNYHGKRT